VGIEIFADEGSYGVLKNIYPARFLHQARLSDYGKEFLSLKMSIKTVKSFNEGLDFINHYTSGIRKQYCLATKNIFRVF